MLNYSVTDSDGNTTTAKQVVLVNDGSFTAGNTFIIQAKNFEIGLGHVDTSDSAVKTAAQVKVFKKADGEEVSEPVSVPDKGGYSAAIGTYNIKFEVTSDTAANKTIQATVITGNAPTLTAPSFTEINIGDSFSPLTGVSASDAEDGDITGNIQITGSVDTNTAGIYKLTYSITDSDNNTASKTHVVLVNDGTYIAGSSYILHAKDFTKRIGQVDTSSSAVKTAATATVYSKTTGDELSPANINIDDLGGYTAAAGEYNIKFSVNGDATATLTIKATVTAGQAPTLTAPSFTEINVGDSFSPLTGVSASDAEDGDITGNIQTTGSVDTTTAGIYKLTYSVTDSDDNTVSKTHIVLVNDGTFVIGTNYIIRVTDFTKRVGEVDTNASAIKIAAGLKLYEIATGNESTATVSITDTGGYKAQVGSYNITFKVTGDTTTTQTITATVVSGFTPSLTAPAFTEITTGTPFNIMSGVGAFDIEDGDLTTDVQVSGSVDISKAGIYKLTYNVTDSDGNTATAKQIVLVNDGSYVVGDDYIIKASNFSRAISKVDTSDDAIKLAAKVGVYEKATGDESNVAVNILDKGGYAAIVGTYNISFEVEGDATAATTIIATVTKGAVPKLTVPSFTNIKVNDSFNPMSGVKATDEEDGDITSTVTVSGSVDTAKAGIYHLTYSVTDNDNNTVTKKRTVLVNDGSYVYDNGFIIQAFDFKIAKSKAKIDDNKIQELAKVKVYDVENEKWLENPEISVNRHNFTDKVGKYPITFTYNPSITVTATVYDNSGGSAKTGDTNNIMGLLAVLSVSGGILLGLVSKRKRIN